MCVNWENLGTIDLPQTAAQQPKPGASAASQTQYVQSHGKTPVTLYDWQARRTEEKARRKREEIMSADIFSRAEFTRQGTQDAGVTGYGGLFDDWKI
ncbi:MAG: hypothetical protein MJ058_04145 [Akkermansia sp.]|nr:hypothetical protein [Akkermansia sp.]